MGSLDSPIPSPPEQAALGSMSLPSTPFASSLVSGSSAPAQLPHAAVAIARSPNSLTSVRHRRFKKLGLVEVPVQFLRGNFALEQSTSITVPG